MHMFGHDGPNLTPQRGPIIGPGQGFYRKSLHENNHLDFVYCAYGQAGGRRQALSVNITKGILSPTRARVMPIVDERGYDIFGFEPTIA